MKIHHFLSRVEHDRIHRAIQDAERGTAGRIVVYVSHERTPDPVKSAEKAFRKLRLESAEQKTGFLLFLAPKARKFAVIGGTALHEKWGQIGWDRLAGLVAGHFKEERYTEGLMAVINEVGRRFQADFPSDRPPDTRRADVIED
jgi:uncharacterized membrane protein